MTGGLDMVCQFWIFIRYFLSYTLNFANNFFSSYKRLKYCVQKHENSKFVITVFLNSNSTYYFSIRLMIDNVLFCITWLRQKTMSNLNCPGLSGVKSCVWTPPTEWKVWYLWHLIHFAWLHYTFYFETTVWASDNM